MKQRGLSVWCILILWNVTICSMQREYCSIMTSKLQEVLNESFLPISLNSDGTGRSLRATYSNPNIINDDYHYWQNQRHHILALVRNGADPETIDCCGRTCLSLALTCDDVETAEYVLKQGANPNVSDSVLFPRPIIYYVRHVESAQLLIRYGLRVAGLPKLLHTIMRCLYQPDLIPLYLAHGADPAEQDDMGNTPLHTLILLVKDRSFRPSDEDVIKKITYLLTAKPGLLDIQNKGGNTPFDFINKGFFVRLDNEDSRTAIRELFMKYKNN